MILTLEAISHSPDGDDRLDAYHLEQPRSDGENDL